MFTNSVVLSVSSDASNTRTEMGFRIWEIRSMPDYVCSAYGHKKDVKAKVMLVLTADPDPQIRRRAGIISEPPGSAVAASNGILVWVDPVRWSGRCWRHEPKDWTMARFPVDRMTGDPALDNKYALSVYEAHLTELAEARAASDRQWAEHRLQDAKTEQFLRDVHEDRSIAAAWIIQNANDLPVSHVSVSRDGGLLFLSTSDYGGHVGRGRGSLRWVRALREALDKAEAVMLADPATATTLED